MARASTLTKLSIDRWAQILGIHPLHVNQVQILVEGEPLGYSCNHLWLQHSWQSADQISREELAHAIKQAEDDIERLLGFRLAPCWEVDEWRPTIRSRQPELVNYYATDIRGYAAGIRANWGHFISGGIQGKTLIPNPSAIDWDDLDGDGYEETGEVTVTTTVTDPCEIGIYFPDHDGADEWEIKPTNVSIAGGVATITFRRELCVLETLQEALVPVAVDGTDDTNFLTEVEVYRKWNDPQTQVTFLWEHLPGTCGCGDATCLVCQYATQTGCLNIREARQSLITFEPATWDADEETFNSADWTVGRQPDIARLYYRAGLRRKSLTCPEWSMDPTWERIVAAYAAALLDRPVCDCSNVAGKVDHWRTDLAFTTGATELASYSLSPQDLANPLGTTRGAIMAWKRVKQESLGEAICA